MGSRSESSPSEQLGCGPDHISALPDDLLLLILDRLGCVDAAARTGALSRRWRNLWPCLRWIVFHNVAFPSVEAALSDVSRLTPPVSLLEIRLPDKPLPGAGYQYGKKSAHVSSLLHAATQLEPKELVVAFPPIIIDGTVDLDLPCFRRATSIVIDMFSTLVVPIGVEFPALETLSLSCSIRNLHPFISCCPRLRTLRLGCNFSQYGALRLNSASLRELVLEVENEIRTQCIDIVAPVLKHLRLGTNAGEGLVVLPLYGLYCVWSLAARGGVATDGQQQQNFAQHSCPGLSYLLLLNLPQALSL